MMKDKKVVDRVKVKITVLTPVHIGNGERYKKGTNFVQDKGEKWYFIDIDKLIEEHWEALYNKLQGHQAQSITSILKFAEELIHNRQIGNWAIPLDNPIYGTDGTDVMPHIKNKLTEKPIIPGSSIKGAFRTVLMWKVMKLRNALLKWKVIKKRKDGEEYYQSRKEFENAIRRQIARLVNYKKELNKIDVANEFLGAFEKAITRHLKIPDVVFEKTEWWNSKVCGVEGDVIQWKDNKDGGYTFNFNPEEFTSLVESVPKESETEADWEIDIMNPLWKERGSHKTIAMHTRTWKALFGEVNNAKDILKSIFFYCNEWMKNYLEEEKKFFNRKKAARHIQKIWNTRGPSEIRFLLDELDKCIKNGNACLLRIGWGSGFHAMTGDWQYADHLEPLKHKGKVKFKTRRILFRKQEGDFQFTLPGFVKIELV